MRGDVGAAKTRRHECRRCTLKRAPRPDGEFGDRAALAYGLRRQLKLARSVPEFSPEFSRSVTEFRVQL